MKVPVLISKLLKGEMEEEKEQTTMQHSIICYAHTPMSMIYES